MNRSNRRVKGAKGAVVDKERGAAGERTGKRGGGGRGRRGGRTTTRPRAEDEMRVVDISELPVGVALETRLHPKRRRTRSPSTSATQAASTALKVEVKVEDILEPHPSTSPLEHELPATAQTSADLEPGLSTSPLEHELPATAQTSADLEPGLSTSALEHELPVTAQTSADLEPGLSTSALEHELPATAQTSADLEPGLSTSALEHELPATAQTSADLEPGPSTRRVKGAKGAVVDKERGAAGERTGKRGGGGRGRRGGRTNTRPLTEDESASLMSAVGGAAGDIGSGETYIIPSTPGQRQHRTPLTEDAIFALNYGSEPESSADEEEDEGLYVPRPYRTLFDDGEMEEPVAPAVPAPVAPASADEAPILEPNDMYHFVWKAFSNPPIRPELRRETFSAKNVGPTTPCVDPYEIFVSIWDRQIMEHIVSETNRYAQEVAQQLFACNRLYPTSRINKWRDTTVGELYLYFAIVLGMGLVVKARASEYWSSTVNLLKTPGFGVYMSLNRFNLLSRCLHFNNNRDMRTEELGPSEAKLFKIAPVLSHLNNKFQSLYQLSQNIALDESLLQWKGWLSINQLIPNKAATVGIKTYEVCESQTGYLWRFEVHAKPRGAVESQPQDLLAASTPAIVLRLVAGLEHRGHTLWMDNFYNSPALARKLKTLGFDNVGTLRTNRQLVPEELTNLTKSNMQVGQITGFTSGDVDLMVWRDSNRVAMISTYHGNASASIGGTRKPILICDYNIMMGGVDKKDQMLSSFPVERKRTRCWYKKFFKRLLNVSVLNSYVIHKASSSSSSSALQHRTFRINLVDALLKRHTPPAPQPPIRNTPDHFLVETTVFTGAPGNRQPSRRACCLCRKRVPTYCVGCNKVCCMVCFPTEHKLRHPR